MLTDDEKDSVIKEWFSNASEQLKYGEAFWIGGLLSRESARFLRDEVCRAIGIEANLFELPPYWDLVIAPLDADIPLLEEMAYAKSGRLREELAIPVPPSFDPTHQ
ncbi:hypothetical protein [Dyella psychrodurans]|uniref:hypothetical protein n=1 Tax=Dyella psychrodurans TaxID=1927960 RepID=UPI0011C06FE9|nr:hypothetical protein [Dyella psychrodurans]